MNVQALSTSTPKRAVAASFISTTTASASSQRAEDILALNIIPGRQWTTTVKINPAQAKQLLLAMPTQRLLQKSNVDYFVGLMRSGRFRTTHQGVAFNHAGKLIDGMHRLSACVQADVEIEVQATFGMSDDAFGSFDRGKGRTTADDLVVRGVVATRQESIILAAAIKILHNYDRGMLPWSPMNKVEVAAIDADALMLRHEELQTTVIAMTKNSRFFYGMSLSGVVAFTTLFRETNLPKAEDFIRQVMHGENLSAGYPAFALREFLRFGGDARRKVINTASMVVFVRCWNAFIERRKLLKVSSSLTNGQFPKVSTGK